MEKTYVYLIENLINHHIYVGITKHSIHERFNQHVKETKKPGPKRVLQRAMIKHGCQNFIIRLLEECENREISFEREKFWIKSFKDQNFILYNSTEGGEDGALTPEIRALISERTKETMKNPEIRKKISEANKGNKNPSRRHPFTLERRQKVSNALKGRKHSEEQRQKQSESMKGEKNWNYGKKFSAEHCAKMSKSIKETFAKKSFEELSQKSKKAMTEDVRKKVSENTKIAMNNPEIRARHLAANAKHKKLQGKEDEIKEMFYKGMKIKEIARYFGVSGTPIYRILGFKKKK